MSLAPVNFVNGFAGAANDRRGPLALIGAKRTSKKTLQTVTPAQAGIQSQHHNVMPDLFRHPVAAVQRRRRPDPGYPHVGGYDGKEFCIAIQLPGTLVRLKKPKHQTVIPA